MSAKAFVEVTAYWGVDDADSTIKLSLESKRRLRPIEFSVAFSGFGSWT